MKAAALNGLSARECTCFCCIYQFGVFCVNSCSFVSQWKWSHSLVSLCHRVVSLPFSSGPWVTFIFISSFTLGLVWSLREAVQRKLYIFLLYLFYGSPESFVPTGITLTQVLSQRKQPTGSLGHRKEREKQYGQETLNHYFLYPYCHSAAWGCRYPRILC